MRRSFVKPDHPELSIRRQCELLELNRATYYYVSATESPLNLELMRLIDEQYLRTPFYGWPRMTVYVQNQGVCHQSQARPTADAEDGHLSDLSQTVPQSGESRP